MHSTRSLAFHGLALSAAVLLADCQHVIRGAETVGNVVTLTDMIKGLDSLEKKAARAGDFDAPPDGLLRVPAMTRSQVGTDAGASQTTARASVLGETAHLALTDLCVNSRRFMVPSRAVVSAEWRRKRVAADGGAEPVEAAAALAGGVDARIRIHASLDYLDLYRGGKKTEDLTLGVLDQATQTKSSQVHCGVTLEFIDAVTNAAIYTSSGTCEAKLSARETETVLGEVYESHYEDSEDAQAFRSQHVHDLLKVATANALKKALPALDAELLLLQRAKEAAADGR